MKYYSLSDFTKKQIKDAQEIVANDRIALAHAIRKEDAYASHVTEVQKIEALNKSLRYAEEIREGEHNNNFTILQRLLLVLTGKCIGLLS